MPSGRLRPRRRAPRAGAGYREQKVGPTPSSSAQPRRQIERGEHRNPNGIDEVPVETADRDWRVPRLVEVAERGPGGERRQNHQADHDMGEVESRDGEEEGSVEMCAKGEGLAVPFQELQAGETRAQDEGADQPEKRLPGLPAAHAALAPP